MSEKSPADAWEMICVDFLAGAHLQEDGDTDVLYSAFTRLYALLPITLQKRFATE